MSRTFKTLLVPLSLTEDAAVLRYARRLADETGGKAILLHVVPTQSYKLLSPIYHPEDSGGANQDAAEQVARAELERLGREQFGVVPYEVAVRTGSNPAKAILAAEEELAADLIMLAKSEAGEIGARLQGGLIEKLIRSSTCPVLGISARAELARPEAAQSFLAPVGFDKKSVTIARLAANFAETMNGRVTLLHVIVPDSVSLELNREAYGLAADQPVNLLRSEKAARARLEEMAAKELGGVPCDVMVVVGTDVATSILEVEEATRPAMILMATAGYTGFFQVVLGSAAETVARRASCSVLTMRLR
jgi:nucleotide-binding universal stress UspA family protein